MGPGKIGKISFLHQHIRIRNEAGRIVNDREKADTFCGILREQWKCEREEPAEQGMNRTPLRGAQDVKTEPITMKELRKRGHTQF